MLNELANDSSFSPFKDRFVKNRLRELFVSVQQDRSLLISIVAGVLAINVAVAAVVHPTYTANSNLLVLMSGNYAARPTAGNPQTASGALDRDAFLKAETEILLSRDVAAAALAKLPPDDAAPRGAIMQWLSTQLAKLRALLPATAVAPEDAQAQRVRAFMRNLSATADKTGNLITVSYRSASPAEASASANAVVAAYLNYRTTLYADRQAKTLAPFVATLHQKALAASAAVMGFRQAHAIVDFPAQNAMLLQQMSDLQRNQQASRIKSAELERQLALLGTQLAATPQTLVLYTDNDMARKAEFIQTNMENLRVKESGLRIKYSDDSPQIKDIEAQLAAAQAQLRQLRASAGAGPSAVREGRNPLYDSLLLSRATAEQQLQAAQAQLTQSTTDITATIAGLSDLQQNQTELQDLENQATVLTQSYSASARELQSRQMVEDITSTAESNVRVIQPAVPPTDAPHIRAVVLFCGLVLSLLAALFVGVVRGLFRQSILCRETLERITGLAIIETMPVFDGRSAALRTDSPTPRH